MFGGLADGILNGRLHYLSLILKFMQGDFIDTNITMRRYQILSDKDGHPTRWKKGTEIISRDMTASEPILNFCF